MSATGAATSSLGTGQKWVSMGTHCSSTGSGVRSSAESTGREREGCGGVGAGGWSGMLRIDADVSGGKTCTAGLWGDIKQRAKCD